jgi:hypothetical protein
MEMNMHVLLPSDSTLMGIYPLTGILPQAQRWVNKGGFCNSVYNGKKIEEL